MKYLLLADYDGIPKNTVFIENKIWPDSISRRFYPNYYNGDPSSLMTKNDKGHIINSDGLAIFGFSEYEVKNNPSLFLELP